MAEPLLQIRNIKKYFPVRKGLLQRKVADVKAVDDVSFELHKGQTLGLVGESGCGKSTLGRTVIRLYEPTAGEIIFRGRNFSELSGKELRAERRNVQMIFQDPYASLDPRMTIAALIEQPFKIHGLLSKEERQAKVEQLIQLVGLKPYHLNRYPHEFSGGQRQRISIARAIALEPELIIADEAVSALDVSIQAQVLNLMKDLQARMGLTYLFISHDMGVIEHMCDEIAVMYLGRIVEKAPTEEFFKKPLHPYTQALLDSVPEVGTKKPRKILTGEVPSPLNPPKGCAFHPRCPHKMDVCTKDVPPMLTQPNGKHQVACWLYKENKQ
jgi:oligopeptide transport system ATP-binding protein